MPPYLKETIWNALDDELRGLFASVRRGFGNYSFDIELDDRVLFEIEDFEMENQCRFTGNIGKVDVKERYVRVSVAVYGGKDKDGKEKTVWVSIFFTGDRLMPRAQNLDVGDMITTTCSYKTWEKDGVYNHAFDAVRLLVLRKKHQSAAGDTIEDGDMGDDIPF